MHEGDRPGCCNHPHAGIQVGQYLRKVRPARGRLIQHQNHIVDWNGQTRAQPYQCLTCGLTGSLEAPKAVLLPALEARLENDREYVVGRLIIGKIDAMASRGDIRVQMKNWVSRDFIEAISLGKIRSLVPQPDEPGSTRKTFHRGKIGFNRQAVRRYTTNGLEQIADEKCSHLESNGGPQGT